MMVLAIFLSFWSPVMRDGASFPELFSLNGHSLDIHRTIVITVKTHLLHIVRKPISYAKSEVMQ